MFVFNAFSHPAQWDQHIVHVIDWNLTSQHIKDTRYNCCFIFYFTIICLTLSSPTCTSNSQLDSKSWCSSFVFIQKVCYQAFLFLPLILIPTSCPDTLTKTLTSYMFHQTSLHRWYCTLDTKQFPVFLISSTIPSLSGSILI